MATEVVPLKVKIGQRSNGHADHPAWDAVLIAMGEPAGTERNFTVGPWHYDKTSGHADDDGGDSPIGVQWGMRLVLSAFATAAVATFPATMSIMTEVEAQSFWETKAYAHLPATKRDVVALQSLADELSLRQAIGLSTTALEATIAAALDPDNSAPGISRQKGKTWADGKTLYGFTIQP